MKKDAKVEGRRGKGSKVRQKVYEMSRGYISKSFEIFVSESDCFGGVGGGASDHQLFSSCVVNIILMRVE